MCELRFERNLKSGADNTTYACPECKDPAPLVMSDFGFSFAQGTSPTANSGVHDLDYPTADKLVGRSADARWAHIREREAIKRKAREQGQTHALIRHTGKDFIDYEPMSEQGRVARRTLAKEAMSKLKKDL